MWSPWVFIHLFSLGQTLCPDFQFVSEQLRNDGPFPAQPWSTDRARPPPALTGAAVSAGPHAITAVCCPPCSQLRRSQPCTGRGAFTLLKDGRIAN